MLAAPSSTAAKRSPSPNRGGISPFVPPPSKIAPPAAKTTADVQLDVLPSDSNPAGESRKSSFAPPPSKIAPPAAKTTADVQLDVLPSDSKPASETKKSKESHWVDGLPNDSVINDMKVFTSKLMLLAKTFRKAKYCIYYIRVHGPVVELFESTQRPNPPDDVMVATLSGCIKTLLKQIQGLKRGREHSNAFLELTSEVQTSLINLVKSIQASMRTFRQMKEQAPHHHRTVTRSAASMGSTQENDIETIQTCINFLLDPPEVDTCSEKLARALFAYPFLMISAMMSFGGGVGVFTCGSYYLGFVNSDRDLSYYFPIGMVMLAIGILVWAIHHSEKDSDMATWEREHFLVSK